MILTALWKRPEITEIMFTGVQRLQKFYSGKISCLAVGSEPQQEQTLCTQYNIQYVTTKNHPLGRKWNTGLQAALKQDFDFLMTLGSDDLISNELLMLYQPYMNTHYCFGARQMYVYNTRDSCAVLFPGYPHQEMSIGAGFMVHREAIEACGKKLWKDGVNEGLDFTIRQRLIQFGYREAILDITDNAAILDIKSQQNLNPYTSFVGTPVPPQTIWHWFPAREVQMIQAFSQY